jgi:hypothetical protein
MQCTDLKCFGNEPVTMDDQSFFLSDHYGLVATLERRKSDQRRHIL